MVQFTISAAKTALLVIDMQQIWVARGAKMEVPSAREMVPKFNTLISTCRRKGIKVIFTRHAHNANGTDLGLYSEFIPTPDGRPFLIDGTPDAEIYDGMDHKSTDAVVTKSIYSAFLGTNLDHILRVAGIDTLIIGGIITAYCCEATARDARHRNYKVIFLSDGNETYEKIPDMGWGEISRDEIQRVVMSIMAYRYAEVLSIQQVLDRLSNI